jgi:hypothetical protein
MNDDKVEKDEKDEKGEKGEPEDKVEEPKGKIKTRGILVTEKMLEDYEKTRLAHLDRLAKGVKKGIPDKIVLPKLNPDGSITDADQKKLAQKVAGSKQAWGGEAKKVN